MCRALTTIKDYTTVSIPYPGQSISQLPKLDLSYLLPQVLFSPKVGPRGPPILYLYVFHPDPGDWIGGVCACPILIYRLL